MKDMTEIAAGSSFTKTWTFRNDGDSVWPAGTKLVQSAGDDLQAQITQIINEVHPGSEVEFTAEFMAPMNEGKYTTFFRLQVGHIKFGQKVWCDIMVVKPKAAAKPVEQIKMVSQDVEMKPEKKEVAEPEPFYKVSMAEDIAMDKSSIPYDGDKDDNGDNENELMKSQISLDNFVSPK